MRPFVIGFFASGREALLAKAKLKTVGFDESRVREQLAALIIAETCFRRVDQLSGRILGPREHISVRCAEQLRRGHTVLLVDGLNDQETAKAKFVLQQAGAFNVEAHISRLPASPSATPVEQVSHPEKQPTDSRKVRETRPSSYRGLLDLAKRTYALFSNVRAASRGAALAFYTVTSIAPILVIVIAVAGFVFGREAASGAVFEQFRGLLGAEGADLLQKAIAGASDTSAGVTASVVSIVTLILGASGVFLELEDALNTIWEAKAKEGLVGMARARMASLGLVIALGFLLIVSLVLDAGLKAFSGYLPFGAALLQVLSVVASSALMTVLFAGIFKYLPAKSISWREVWVGAAVTAVLFALGKFLIGLYLGSSSTASSLGAAGALLALLFWVYYSAQIFLLGAAFTKVHAANIAKPQSESPHAAQTERADPVGKIGERVAPKQEAWALGLLGAFLLSQAIARGLFNRKRHAVAQAKTGL